MVTKTEIITTETEATEWLDEWDLRFPFEFKESNTARPDDVVRPSHEEFLAQPLPFKIIEATDDLNCGRYLDAVFAVADGEYAGDFGREAEALRQMANLLGMLQETQDRSLAGDYVGAVTSLRDAAKIRLPGERNRLR